MFPAILALETSTEMCSVALTAGGQLWRRAVPAAAGHSENLLPMVKELLEEAGLALSNLDALAYGAGPGAFTGLRLACGVAQGLAFGLGLPVIGIGSLEAMAWASGKSRVYTCADARMNEVYFAAYERGERGMVPALPAGVAPPQAAGLPIGQGWFGCGSGFSSYPQQLEARLAPYLAGMDAAMIPDAAAVAQLAILQWPDSVGQDAFTAQPAYVRQKVALTTAERIARGGKA